MTDEERPDDRDQRCQAIHIDFDEARRILGMPPRGAKSGWQDEPPGYDCPCWIELRSGEELAVAWQAIRAEPCGVDGGRFTWFPNEILRYNPYPKPPPYAIPIPNGGKAIDGYETLYEDHNGFTRTREHNVIIDFGKADNGPTHLAIWNHCSMKTVREVVRRICENNAAAAGYAVTLTPLPSQD